MPWTTANSRALDFPHALFAKLAHASKPKLDDVMDACQAAKRIHAEAVSLSNRVADLELQVMRLTHENEFMLRLVNERDAT